MVLGRAVYSEVPTYELSSPGGRGEADIAEAKENWNKNESVAPKF